MSFNIPNSLRLLPKEFKLSWFLRGFYSKSFLGPFIGLFATFAFTAHFVLFDILSRSENHLLWSLAHVSSIAAFLFFLIIGFSIVSKVENSIVRIALNLVFITLASFSRGLVLVWVVSSLGISEFEQELFRLPGSFNSLAIFAVVAALYAGSKDEYHESVESYSKVLQTHTHNLQQNRNQLDLMHRKIKRVVENDLLFSLKSLQSRLESASKSGEDLTDYTQAVLKDLLFRTRRVILDTGRIYRPLVESIPVSFTPTVGKLRHPVGLRSVISPLAPTLFLVPFMLLLASSVSTLTPAVNLSGAVLISSLVISLLATFVPGRINVSSYLAFVISGLFGAAMGLGSFVIADQLLPNTDPARGLIYVPIPVMAISMMAMTAGIIFQQQREVILDALEELKLEQQRSVDLVQQEIWQSKRKWDSMLHGYLQGILTAALGRINLNDGLDSFTVLKEVDRAIQITSQGPEPSKDFALLKQELIETWEDVCKLNIEASFESAEVLKSNEVASESVFEILREAVSNAIRHGNATEFEGKIERTENYLIVEAINNGSEVQHINPKGIGFRLFEELASDFSIENIGGKVKLSAKVTI